MLITTSFVTAVFAAAMLVPVAWVAWEFRRWHRREGPRGARLAAARAAFALGLAVVVVAASAAAINRHYSYIADAGLLVGHARGDLAHRPRYLAATETQPLHGTVVKEELGGIRFSAKPLYIYLPPGYSDVRNELRRYPVLYLLHGSPGIAIDWIRTGHVDTTMDALLRENAVHPFIIAMPDFDLGYARDTQCEDIPGGPQMQTYLTHDVVSFVDAHFRTLATRSDRIIGGFSAGAYCGINLVMRHQNVFSAFVSQCGYTKPDENAYTRDLFGGSALLRRENTPADYLPWMPIEHPLGAYIEAGSEDRAFRGPSEYVAEILRLHGAIVTFHLFDGHDHTWADARAHASYVLRWASSWFVPPPDIVRTPLTSTEWRKRTRV
jgi:enterochelin esterase-like enzyme